MSRLRIRFRLIHLLLGIVVVAAICASMVQTVVYRELSAKDFSVRTRTVRMICWTRLAISPGNTQYKSTYLSEYIESEVLTNLPAYARERDDVWLDVYVMRSGEEYHGEAYSLFRELYSPDEEVFWRDFSKEEPVASRVFWTTVLSSLDPSDENTLVEASFAVRRKAVELGLFVGREK